MRDGIARTAEGRQGWVGGRGARKCEREKAKRLDVPSRRLVVDEVMMSLVVWHGLLLLAGVTGLFVYEREMVLREWVRRRWKEADGLDRRIHRHPNGRELPFQLVCRFT